MEPLYIYVFIEKQNLIFQHGEVVPNEPKAR